MGALKERDYMFDTFRGILILLIPISHFTKMSGNLYGDLFLGGGFHSFTLEGFIYITINLFAMQSFMFLSGYFSKRPERAKETAFDTFLWPYLVFTFLYYGVRCFFFDKAVLDFLSPPFALWFLFVLFFYRYFLRYMVKIRHLFTISIVMFLVAGQIEIFGEFLALGRAVSYFPFFLLGYYCSKERMLWVRQLKKRPAALGALIAVLLGASAVLAKFGPVVSWYLLRAPASDFGMVWWHDVLLRIMLFCIATGWMVVMVNILPSGKNFMSYVGVNTMPVYVFHLVLRYVIDFYGLYVCFISCLVVAWFAILSLLYKKKKDMSAPAAEGWHFGKTEAIYAAAVIISAAAAALMYMSGSLEPLYGLCPENRLMFYMLIYVSAITAGLSFVSPFWIKCYDLIIKGPEHGSVPARWLSAR